MTEDDNRRLLRARDAIDRHYAEPLDLERLRDIACGQAPTAFADGARCPTCPPCFTKRWTRPSSHVGAPTV